MTKELTAEEVASGDWLTACPICAPKLDKEQKIGEVCTAPVLIMAKGDKEGYCAVCKRTWSELQKWMEAKKRED